MVRVKKLLDILTGLIGLLGVIPVFFYLDKVPQVVFLVSLSIAAFGMWKELPPLRGWYATLLSGLFFIYYAFQFSRDNLIGPAVSIMVILLSVRLSGERNARNCLQLFALSLITLAASSQFNLSAVFLVYLALLILFIAVALVLLTFFTVDSRLCLTMAGVKRVIWFAAAMPLASLPLILVLFIILPRPQFPLWDIQALSGAAATGLSDRVEPGSTRQVNETKSVVFRAESKKLPDNELYWRGIVFNAPRGSAWVRKDVDSGEFTRGMGGRLVRQKIFSEPTGSRYLIALDTPVSVGGMPLERARDLVFRRKGASTGRSRYESVSALGGVISPHDGIDREFYLTLPDQVSPRVLSLGRTIARQGATSSERLSLLEKHYLQSHYRYTVRNLPGNGDPIEEFLGGAKAGNCEFFASSFALLLRAAGVPARIVGGYHGGEYNELAGYYLVTENMAHVWVEVYIDGVGWVRKDPTAFALNPPGERNAAKASFVANAVKLIDSFSYYWNMAVINYDLDKQISMFRSASTLVGSLSLPFGKRVFVVAFSVIMAISAGCFIIKRARRFSRERRLILKFLRKVGNKYPSLTIYPSTGLVELAEQTDDPLVRRFVSIYIGSIYRDRILSQEEKAELHEILKAV